MTHNRNSPNVYEYYRANRLSGIRMANTLNLQEAEFEMMTNLKMNLKDVDEKLSAKDFYGKVIKHLEKEGQTHVVHFTSIPPEVDSYFLALRQYVVKSTAI